MPSSVFYRFRHQNTDQKVSFDGTGISVFELKRDIITQNKLGEGTDFELTLYNPEGGIYEDDTTIIPRSTTVIARRSPARGFHKGGAARYVSGRMPVNALSAKKALNKAEAIGAGLGGGAPTLSAEAQSEEEKLSALLQSGKQEWAKQQEMLEAGPARRPFNKADVPDKPPPPGYVCYRCGEKGHWIQACPTNNDPTYVSQPRFKRTTGIPKSMLQKVNKEDLADLEERPAGLMLSAEGDWVMAKSDYEEFKKYQAKVRQSKVAREQQGDGARGSKELQDRGLECPLDRRLFVEPMRTPCCAKTYCGECVGNALIDNDLHCPNCQRELLFDDLTPDEEKRAAVRAYEAERAEGSGANKAKDEAGQQQRAPPAEEDQQMAGAGDDPHPSIEPSEDAVHSAGAGDVKKRKADGVLENHRAGSGPPQAPPKGQGQAQGGRNISGKGKRK